MQRIDAERKMKELLNAVSRYLIWSAAGECFQRILIRFFKENLIIVQKFWFLCRSRKSCSRTRYSISSDFREKQRGLRTFFFRLLGRSGLQYSENRFRDSTLGTRGFFSLRRGASSATGRHVLSESLNKCEKSGKKGVSKTNTQKRRPKT